MLIVKCESTTILNVFLRGSPQAFRIEMRVNRNILEHFTSNRVPLFDTFSESIPIFPGSNLMSGKSV